MNIGQHVFAAFLLRIACVFYSEFHDSYFSVKYTDIDYHVFTDAAELVNEGQSPFGRHTYRYTPFLAFLLCPNTILHFAFGKIIFSLLDVLTGLFIFHILQNCGHDTSISKRSSFLWLYNPMAIVIATRGSCESVMTSLTMLSILFLQHSQNTYLGLVYGFSIHFKLYPAIHALIFYISVSGSHLGTNDTLEKLYLMFYPCRKRQKFVFFATIGFVVPTVLSYHWYGTEYINEAFLYHIIRKDIKHNFSPYFYITYLSELSDVKGFDILKLAFLFQAALVIIVTIAFSSPRHLPICLFVQTFIFVTFNKVCTSQYFLWYFCLLPLNFPFLHHGIMFKGIILWLLGQAVWLLPAYYLEFQGLNMFAVLWGASLIMFSINIFLICAFCTITLYGSGNQQTVVKNIKQK